MKIICVLSIFLVVFGSISWADDASSPCADWEQYKDELCYKIFLDLKSHSEAEQVCSYHNSSMVSIHYAEEQKFLNQFLFTNKKIVDNVWLGARYTGNGQFQWADHTFLKTENSSKEYTNWMVGSPKNLSNYCLQMVADVNLQGKWADEPCTRKNLVICQRTPTLSLKLLSQTMVTLKHRLQVAEKELAEIKKDTIPVGFIYVQLPKTKSPEELWPGATWKEISSEFEGVFFRVVGGNASAFGQVQQENAPRLETVFVGDSSHLNGDGYSLNNNLTIPVIGWSKAIVSGGDMVNHDRNYIKFKNSDLAEVRPKNTAVRVYKRTA